MYGYISNRRGSPPARGQRNHWEKLSVESTVESTVESRESLRFLPRTLRKLYVLQETLPHRVFRNLARPTNYYYLNPVIIFITKIHRPEWQRANATSQITPVHDHRPPSPSTTTTQIVCFTTRPGGARYRPSLPLSFASHFHECDEPTTKPSHFPAVHDFILSLPPLESTPKNFFRSVSLCITHRTRL